MAVLHSIDKFETELANINLDHYPKLYPPTKILSTIFTDAMDGCLHVIARASGESRQSYLSAGGQKRNITPKEHAVDIMAIDKSIHEEFESLHL